MSVRFVIALALFNMTSVRTGRVLLTHLQMGLDPVAPVRIVADAVSGPVALVEPGDVIELSRA